MQNIYDPPDSSKEDVIDPAPTKRNANPQYSGMMISQSRLQRAVMEGRLWEVETIVRGERKAIGEAINNDDETVLHILVRTGHNYFLRKLLNLIKDTDADKDILKRKSSDGSTALHIAAITGNKIAADLLIKKMQWMMTVEDSYDHIPFVTAFLHMKLDTSVFLVKAIHKCLQNYKWRPEDLLMAFNLLVVVISSRKYDLALDLLNAFPNFTAKDTFELLMTLARDFPSGVGYYEKKIYPSLTDVRCMILKNTCCLLTPVQFCSSGALAEPVKDALSGIIRILIVLVIIPIMVFQLLFFLIWTVYLVFRIAYWALWNVARLILPSIRCIEKKVKEYEKAKEVLKKVFEKIDKLGNIDTQQFLYKEPLLEAARGNAYEVVDEILSRSPQAIYWKDKNGFNIIHLAVIHRSEKIYNLIYDNYVNVDRRSLYKEQLDSSDNNILHLVGRLAPSNKLKSRRGAALQLQRELQWSQELKKLADPAFISEKNMYGETPGMVFTREHESMVKEGETWMKNTAESCSITAALITTIVFAAAITVPGGSHQETGVPLFKKNAAFIVFAASDSIALCASTMSLLMFLSILTTRFAEQDFLFDLPNQLILGLCALLISTTAMMVAFGATLFLVFSHQKAWMLGPICGLLCIPITSFAILQFPLIADLILSTHSTIFAKPYSSRRGQLNRKGLWLFPDKLSEYILGFM